MLKVNSNQQYNLWKKQNHFHSVALVPTMGALHAGHLSLIDKAQECADKVVVSIFVNPTQFGVDEDFASYPRQIEKDLAMLENKGVDVAFTPDVDLLYPDKSNFLINPNKLANDLCGAVRPGHFAGVCTVVMKLINFIRPNFLVLGAKDYQQVIIIEQMLKDFFIDCQLIIGDIVRDDSGLALSSRNEYLSDNEKLQAAKLYSVLNQVAEMIINGKAVDESCNIAKVELVKRGFQVDYLTVRNAKNLDHIIEDNLIVLVAAKLNEVRLIDNLVFNKFAKEKKC